MNFISYHVVILLTVNCFLAREVDAYRILGVFPLGYRSHNIFFTAIMKALAKEGHQVDVISHHELSDPPNNYRTILNLANVDYPFDSATFDNAQQFIDIVTDPVQFIIDYCGSKLCKLMAHKKMHEIFHNPPKDPAYDAIILEGLTMSCFNGLGHLLNVPVITATPSLELPWISRQIGNPLSTAYFPTFTMSKVKINTFWDRLQNTLKAQTAIERFFAATYGPQTEAMRKFLNPDMPNVREIERSVALSLVNTYYTFNGVRPTTPAFVEVAGLHIEEDNSTLTTELKQWMDESKNGVVYISFGSLVDIETFSREVLSAIYKSFAKIKPLRVLMKASDNFVFPPTLPENVLTMTWIPQISVLGHNNTRVFISHGGAHSLQEAVYHAIPIIGVPLVYDQQQNIDKLVNKKMCIRLNYDDITEEALDEALREILNKPEYRQAAKYQSRLFRDRPMSPKKTAVYWIEYIIRNGAKSLRSPALDLHWWQLQLLDVYGFLILCFILVLYIISIVLKIVFENFFIKNRKIELKRD